MFLKFYGLREQPFGVTPDPRFLYLGAAHRETLASLYYGVESGRGFLALIAKPGMGKTTLLFHLLEKFRSTARTAFLFQTQCDSREFIRFLLCELDCESPDQDFVRMHERFNRLLLQEARAGNRFIVVIDEAHNLQPSVLETIRLLSDFETPRAKLMQIILAGQPELADKLASRDLCQLRQRVSLLNGLIPLSSHETRSYIEHRIQVAGYAGARLFTPEALEAIADCAEGIPRNISNLCFHALSLGCALRQKIVDLAVVQEVISDLDISKHVTELEPAPSTSPARPTRHDRVIRMPHTLGVGREASASGNRLESKSDGSEVLTPADARAYMQKVVLALRRQQPMLGNQASYADKRSEAVEQRCGARQSEGKDK